MYSFKVESNIGIPDSILEEINDLSSVDEVESFNETYRFFTYNNNPYQAKVLLLTDKMNIPLRIKGVLPKKAGEAAIDSHFAGFEGKRVLVFDEFQYILKYSNEFTNHLFDFLNSADGTYFVILISSSIAWVENSMVGKIGQRARGITGFFKVKELSFGDFRTYFNKFSLSKTCF